MLMIVMLVMVYIVKLHPDVGVADVCGCKDNAKAHPSLGVANVSGCINGVVTPWCWCWNCTDGVFTCWL